jgi:Flp pilus assembly pilin Flp
MKILIRLWRDQRGEASAIAVVLLYTLLALGAIVGLVAVRNQIVQELGDLAVALESLDQSYTLYGEPQFVDEPGLTDAAGEPPAGIDLGVAPPTLNLHPGEDGA